MMSINAKNPPAARLARYLAMADTARREALRSQGEARESYLFIAEQWELLAEMAQNQARQSPPGNFR
jgi:hypothetical protein